MSEGFASCLQSGDEICEIGQKIKNKKPILNRNSTRFSRRPRRLGKYPPRIRPRRQEVGKYSACSFGFLAIVRVSPAWTPPSEPSLPRRSRLAQMDKMGLPLLENLLACPGGTLPSGQYLRAVTLLSARFWKSCHANLGKAVMEKLSCPRGFGKAVSGLSQAAAP